MHNVYHKMVNILIYTYLLINAVIASQDAPEVTIEEGTLRGTYQQTWKGRTFSSFTGIRYGEPPIGDLRFKIAVPTGPWEGIYDASKTHPVCPQINLYFGDNNVIGDEDCLYLNVYTPQLHNSSKTARPVMYFIHGGGWMSGGAPLYGPEILLDKDIVLVISNYRLGPLGFLSTADDVVPGNNGLKDQILVLKWIKKNIAHFGGDPERITVFGQSADLISGAIAQSGTSLSLMSLAPPGKESKNSKKLAQFLNCPIEPNQEMIDCLRKVKMEDIVKQDTKFLEWSYDPMIPFPPVIEPNLNGAFLTEDPIDIIKSGEAANIPFMTGITSQDGAMKSANLYNDSNLVKELNDNFMKLAPFVFLYHETAPDKDYVSYKIREYYLGNHEINNSTINEITDMCTDAYFVLPANSIMHLHSKYSKQPLYYYLFEYRGSATYAGVYGDPSRDFGVCHGDDLLYLLNAKSVKDYKPTESDKKMTDMMVTLWTNFAKNGNPTPDETNTLIPAKWNPIQSEKLEYYHIKSDTDVKMNDSLYLERAKFWRNLPLDPRRNKVNDE